MTCVAENPVMLANGALDDVSDAAMLVSMSLCLFLVIPPLLAWWHSPQEPGSTTGDSTKGVWSSAMAWAQCSGSAWRISSRTAERPVVGPLTSMYSQVTWESTHMMEYT